MNSEQLFGMALSLHTPWQVDSIEFKPGTRGGEELHLTIGFARGSRFADASGQACPVHDTVMRTWQHLNFFEHPCYLHCAVPRIKTRDGRVETVSVPWARSGSGFTLLFEALAMALIEREMPVKRVAEMLRVNPQRVWTVFNHWVCEARKRDDPSTVTRLGFDETSSRKGHEYITLGVDMDAKRPLHAEPGKGAEASEGLGAPSKIVIQISSLHTHPGGVMQRPAKRSSRSRSSRPAWTCRPPSWPGSASPSRRRRSPLTVFMWSSCSTRR